MEYQIAGLQKIEIRKFARTGRKQTKEQVLAEEIWRYFGKEIQFPRLMYYITHFGYQFTYEKFNEARKAKIPALPLFLSAFKKTKIIWR